MLLHATCIARARQGVLLQGKPGSGKSDLALRLMGLGCELVADDQVQLRISEEGLFASPPPELEGLLEVRGIGLVKVPYRFRVPVALVVHLLAPESVETRLPEAQTTALLGVQLPVISLHPFHASTPQKIMTLLDCMTGKITLTEGAL
jgi:HPr kinase/phosphorylase